ncbi:hypothetical protein [Bosea sp. RAC05]|uniref:hypothetical protein n=1 Tax=Bosea sp. RAC05 TaxID=1842539 RepID=UPI00083D1DAC|nr:hypothetical protein [Bosea sp. RAC05]
MSISSPQIVTEEHIAAFGSIIHYYAYAESGIKITLAGLLDMDLREMLILSEPYSSMNLRTVAKSIVKERLGPGKEADQFIQLIGELGTFGPLRNAIAHQRWTKGARPGSIRPFHLDIRSGSALLKGQSDTEKDWTAAELAAEGDRARKLNASIVRYMQSSGIIDRMDRKHAARSSATESSDGSSTND